MRVGSIHQERQLAPVWPWVLVGALYVVVFAMAVATREWAALYASLPAILIASVIYFAFSALEVAVGAGVLEWHFRFGVWRKRIALGDIASVEVVPSPWWYGWGIRYTPRGWLYNVRSGGAVEVTQSTGKRVLIGSDRPEHLAQAIRRRLPA